MNALKVDIVQSLDQPQVCEQCTAQLKQALIPTEILQDVSRELKRIRKPILDRILSFVREHTIWSILISAASALLLGIIASVVASYIYEWLIT